MDPPRGPAGMGLDLRATLSYPLLPKDDTLTVQFQTRRWQEKKLEAWRDGVCSVHHIIPL